VNEELKKNSPSLDMGYPNIGCLDNSLSQKYGKLIVWNGYFVDGL